MSTENQGLFINGRAQVIEMLEYMTSEERDKLIKNIRIRNPQLANELMEKSFTFKDLLGLKTENIQVIFKYITPQILGLALKGISVDNQKKMLSIAPRDYAEKAYDIMVRTIPNEERDTQRAQHKIISVFINLVKKKAIRN